MDTKKLEALIMLALGKIVACWSPTPTGAFDDGLAIAIGEQLVKEVLALVPPAPPVPA